VNEEQVAWLCGMGVGVIFGALIVWAPGWWGFIPLLGWLIVLLGYFYEKEGSATSIYAGWLDDLDEIPGEEDLPGEELPADWHKTHPNAFGLYPQDDDLEYDKYVDAVGEWGIDEEGDAHDYWPRPAANKWGDWVDEDQPVS
jgi:hypothetical protein